MRLDRRSVLALLTAASASPFLLAPTDQPPAKEDLERMIRDVLQEPDEVHLLDHGEDRVLAVLLRQEDGSFEGSVAEGVGVCEGHWLAFRREGEEQCRVRVSGLASMWVDAF